MEYIYVNGNRCFVANNFIAIFICFIFLNRSKVQIFLFNCYVILYFPLKLFIEYFKGKLNEIGKCFAIKIYIYNNIRIHITLYL